DELRLAGRDGAAGDALPDPQRDRVERGPDLGGDRRVRVQHDARAEPVAVDQEDRGDRVERAAHLLGGRPQDRGQIAVPGEGADRTAEDLEVPLGAASPTTAT